MCTVSFIPEKDKYYIVSNRDESAMRKPALPPTVYTINQTKLIYPKDADAGGSWIAMCENGNACVLLNGAFQKHHSQHPYEHSRGLVFLNIIANQNPLQTFLDLNLSRIEPFTIILVEKGNLYECRWDGNKKHKKELSNQHPHIWSSVTLYDAAMIFKREQWFADFLQNNQSPGLKEILQFHQFAGDGDTNIDFLMNRNEEMLTVSVTGMEISPDNGKMQYIDLKTKTQVQQVLAFVSILELS